MAQSQFKVDGVRLTYQPTDYTWTDPEYRYTMDGHVRVQGRPRCVWIREITHQDAVNEWFSLMDSEDQYSKAVSVDLLERTNAGYVWASYSGILLRPTIDNSRAMHHDNLQMEFIQLEKLS
jgi:hypothetical protein